MCAARYFVERQQAGVENEEALLGLPSWKPGYPQKLTDGKEEMGYKVDPAFMISEIREGYAGDIRNPSEPFARELRTAICESLGLSGEHSKRVHFYSTLRTPLDRHCGADFVIEIEIPPADRFQRAKVCVSLTADVTLQVKTEWKSDIIVNTIPRSQRKDFQAAVAFIADQFAQEFRKRLTEDQLRRLDIKPTEPRVRGRMRLVRPPAASAS